MTAAVLQHVPFETPRVLAPVLRDAPRVYGLLFHLELDREGLDILCRECPGDVAAARMSAEALIAEALPHLPTLQHRAQSFLRRLLAS